MISKLFFIFSTIVSGFITPTVKIESGNKLSISGKGPPLLFSSGLFGTMPRFIYNDFINNLKKNATVITIDGVDTIKETTIDEVCNALLVDKIDYISHSSFFPEVLSNDKINRVVLLDPINLPQISLDGLTKPSIDLKMPTLIIKAEKLYNGTKQLPKIQEPDFLGYYIEETSKDVGHIDILDDNWVNIGKTTGIWETLEGTVKDYNSWTGISNNNIRDLRKQYRQSLAKKILEFLRE